MKPEEYYKVISDELAKIKVLIDTENSINLLDKNIFLKDILANILNIIYDLSLVNTNFSISNYPSIDLKDEINKTAVQVTTNVTRIKVQNTLDTFFKKEYDKTFDRLFIVLFDNHSYREEFTLSSKFNFNKDDNIITYEKLLKIIKSLADDKLKRIYDYIDIALKKNIYNLYWMKKNTIKSLNNLDKRYNRKLNVFNEETNKIKMFFSQEDCKKEIINMIEAIIILIENNDIKTNFKINEIVNNFTLITINEKLEVLSRLEKSVCKNFEEKENDYYDYNKIQNFETEYYLLLEKLNNLIALYFSKVIIYSGVAGIGKSHTLASFVNEDYISKNFPALLVLGQDFSDGSNIENQFCEITSGKNNFDELLFYLNELGRVRNIIVPIIIDGLNESNDNSIWKKGLNNFINEVTKYSNLKLVLSVRETYFEFCIPEEVKNRNGILLYNHEGFNGNSIKAIEEFFEFYGIDIPIFQIIHNEFKNPLFLTTYCNIVSKYNIQINENEYKNFIQIFQMYLYKINEIFVEKYNLLNKPNIIKEVLNNYIQKWVENNKSITEKEFLTLLSEISELYDISKREILNFVIENGLFYKERRFNKEIIVFTYERYEKICLAMYLLESINSIDELKQSINDGLLKEYVDSSDKFDNGILEELINIIQEDFKVDFVSIISFDKIKVDYFIKKDYIKSLLWFKGQYDINIIINNIKGLYKDEDYANEIIDVFIKMSYLETNPLNIKILNEYMLKLSMPQLDYNWSIVIDFYYSDFKKESIDNIINYCLNYGSEYLNDNTIYLLSVLFSWFLSSSNRYLRDMSTKSLTKLLLNNHKVSVELLKNFKSVSDIYVLERIVAAIYGSIIRSSNSNNIEELSHELYNVIYKNEKPIDNVVIKVYSRKIFAYIKEKYQISLYDNIENEAKSEWYQHLPTNNEIDKYDVDYKAENVDKRKYSNSAIIHSMVTEYGRGTSAYGDFGRYVLGYFLKPFAYVVEDVQLLANKATERVFDYGYDYKLFGNYDSAVKYNQHRHEHSTERIGKKYQWIATYELLSKLYDNFIPHYNVYGDDIIDFDNREYFDKDHKRTFDESSIRYVKYNLEEEFNKLLTIDTTNFILEQGDKKNYLDNNNFDINNEENYSEYVVKDINNIKYISLFNLFSAEDRNFNLKNVDRNSLTIACTAFVYSDKEKLEKSDYKDYSQGTYNEIFNIQLFDIPQSSEYKLNYDRKYQNQDLQTSYKTCYEEYIWEKEYDESIRNPIKILVPQKWIIDDFCLEHRNEGEWYRDNELLCFQPLLKDGEQELVIKYDEFIKFLKDKNLNLGWTIYCEKSHNNNYVSWRVNLFYDFKNMKFNNEVYDKEEWESRPLW